MSIRTIFLSLMIISYACGYGALHFLMNADCNDFPALHICKNGVRLLSAVIEANGVDWTVENILIKDRYGQAYFGKDNRLTLACHSDRASQSENIEFLDGIKKGLDIMSSRGDTIYLLNGYWHIDPIEFQTDSSYRDSILSKYHSVIDARYRRMSLQTQYYTIEIFNNSSGLDSPLVEYETFFRYMRIWNVNVRAASLIYEKYKEDCRLSNRNILGTDSNMEVNKSLEDYYLYLIYLLLSSHEILNAPDEYNFKFITLPITYETDKKP